MIIRMKYRKTMQGRFLSHLDLLRTMQRVFRRAGLPLAYSEGFNPHPKISYGSALAVGVTSDGEYLDVELRQDLPLPEIKERLESAVPPGLEFLELKKLEGRQESLTAIINMARYRVETALEQEIPREQAKELAAILLQQEKIMVTREGKKGPRSIDIRPGIFHAESQAEGTTLSLILELQTGSEGNVRPEELVAWLKENVLEPRGYKLKGNLRIHRIGLFVKSPGGIRTPMED